MATQPAFFSYVHKDDEAEGYRISQLSRDIASQFEMLTGDQLEVFLDKDNIAWGEDWKDKIDKSLASVAFFIAVLTPRYFKSPQCRRELQYFARRASKIGVKELVLPLIYIDFPDFHDNETKDDLIRLIQAFQWENWSELRFSDRASESYRRAVSDLAKHLINANQRADQADTIRQIVQLESSDGEGDDDSLGMLDQLAITEETWPKLNNTLEELSNEITKVGGLMREATDDMNRSTSQGQGISKRLVIARRLSGQLENPTNRILELGNNFASQLHDVDEGTRLYLRNIPEGFKNGLNTKEEICAFFNSIVELHKSTDMSLGSIQTLLDAIIPIEKMSRDLRRPLRRMRQGLTTIIEASKVMDGWINLIETSGIDCNEQ